MHRRAVVFLLGFLVAIVVVGGGGVRAPWAPGHTADTAVAAPANPVVGAPRLAIGSTRIRVE